MNGGKGWRIHSQATFIKYGQEEEVNVCSLAQVILGKQSLYA